MRRRGVPAAAAWTPVRADEERHDRSARPRRSRRDRPRRGDPRRRRRDAGSAGSPRRCWPHRGRTLPRARSRRPRARSAWSTRSSSSVRRSADEVAAHARAARAAGPGQPGAGARDGELGRARVRRDRRRSGGGGVAVAGRSSGGRPRRRCAGWSMRSRSAIPRMASARAIAARGGHPPLIAPRAVAGAGGVRDRGSTARAACSARRAVARGRGRRSGRRARHRHARRTSRSAREPAGRRRSRCCGGSPVAARARRASGTTTHAATSVPSEDEATRLARLLAELQDDILTSYERDEPPDLDYRHDRSRRSGPRGSASAPATCLDDSDRRRSRARRQPVAARRRSRDAGPTCARSGSRSSSPPDQSAAWMSDELSWRITMCGRTAVIPLRITALYAHDGDRWVPVFEHLSFGVGADRRSTRRRPGRSRPRSSSGDLRDELSGVVSARAVSRAARSAGRRAGPASRSCSGPTPATSGTARTCSTRGCRPGKLEDRRVGIVGRTRRRSDGRVLGRRLRRRHPRAAGVAAGKVRMRVTFVFEKRRTVRRRRGQLRQGSEQGRAAGRLPVDAGPEPHVAADHRRRAHPAGVRHRAALAEAAGARLRRRRRGLWLLRLRRRRAAAPPAAANPVTCASRR